MDNITSSKENHASWIESLALEEINMEESGVVNINEHLNANAILEQSSIGFMNQLRDSFEVYISKFNEYRGRGGAQIKIFKISNTINDFMLFRNSLRLIIARKSSDIVSIGFLSGGKEVFSARTMEEEKRVTTTTRTHDIEAHIGPFHNVSWRFNGEPVDVNSLVRYYLSEFIRNSAR
ncbi:MAG: hypothetical protein OXB84_00435 [Halobacteriovoraceae bacterium]|nr:hypothetical protein [Halobacteriovoraceae bacterium]